MVHNEDGEYFVSKRIRDRLVANGVRYFASDNISSHLDARELDELVDELTTKFEGVLDSLVIDRANDPNSMDTARRLAKMYVYELMGGRYTPRPTATSFPNEGHDRFEGMLCVQIGRAHV